MQLSPTTYIKTLQLIIVTSTWLQHFSLKLEFIFEVSLSS